jgi:hypothetical protein
MVEGVVTSSEGESEGGMMESKEHSKCASSSNKKELKISSLSCLSYSTSMKELMLGACLEFMNVIVEYSIPSPGAEVVFFRFHPETFFSLRRIKLKPYGVSVIQPYIATMLVARQKSY